MKGAMKKAMKGKSMKRVSKVAHGKMARAMVLRGSKATTTGGLTKASLTRNKSGKIVSKAASANGKKAYKRLAGWNKAVAQAKKELKLSGFVPLGGKSAKGRALYAKAKALYKK